MKRLTRFIPPLHFASNCEAELSEAVIMILLHLFCHAVFHFYLRLKVRGCFRDFASLMLSYFDMRRCEDKDLRLSPHCFFTILSKSIKMQIFRIKLLCWYLDKLECELFCLRLWSKTLKHRDLHEKVYSCCLLKNLTVNIYLI